MRPPPAYLPETFLQRTIPLKLICLITSVQNRVGLLWLDVTGKNACGGWANLFLR